MQLYRGADIIQCEINGRPLHLPVLSEGHVAMLVDCGTQQHAAHDVVQFFASGNIESSEPRWLAITHPDADHCGGLRAVAERYPKLLTACGRLDEPLVECPDVLFSSRYDAYREEHGIFYDQHTASLIRNCCGGPQSLTLTLVGNETVRLGEDRSVEIWHLPGHSHGHLGVFDKKYRTLFYGDAIQGAGYQSLKGEWLLCPTYLYVNEYLATIDKIEGSEAEVIVGCHWPICHGRREIEEFCSVSREFVLRTDELVKTYLRQHRSGASLRELCESLGPTLGSWPTSVNLELAFAVSGHLQRCIDEGVATCDRFIRPILYHAL